MPLQYIKDNYDNTTAVVIPIKDWERITHAHQDISLMLEPKTDTGKKIKPSDFRGCISQETADQLNSHIQQSRNEWSSNI
jgi:hypothetical protein